MRVVITRTCEAWWSRRRARHVQRRCICSWIGTSVPKRVVARAWYSHVHRRLRTSPVPPRPGRRSSRL